MRKKVHKVLIVDDNKDTCRIMSGIFREKGYRVNIAYDGKSALQRVTQQPYDLMILDYHLPSADGLAILKRTSQIRSSLKTVMISASANEAVKRKAQNLGVYIFFDKPFDIDHLLSVVKKALKTSGIRIRKDNVEILPPPRRGQDQKFPRNF